MIRRLATLALVLAAAACAHGTESFNVKAAARLRDGMGRLGASDAKGKCMADNIDRHLRDADDDEAVRIVENAKSKDDMTDRVLNANDRVRQAFITAGLGCSLAGGA